MHNFTVMVSHGANGVIFVHADVDGVRVKKKYSDGWTIKDAVGNFIKLADKVING